MSKEIDKQKVAKEAWDLTHKLFSGLDYWRNDIQSCDAEAKVNRQVLKFALKSICTDLQTIKDKIRIIMEN
jgi:hypothetical protein